MGPVLRGAVMGASAKAVSEVSDEDVVRMFEQVNNACPRKVDKWTRLVEVKVLDDQSVEYRYEVSDTGKRMVSKASRKLIRQNMVQAMKGNPVAVAIAERDMVIEHVYKDRSGNKLMSFAITRSMLNGEASLEGFEADGPFAATSVSSEQAEPTLPQRMRPYLSSPDNPAGIHANPFVD